MVRDNQLDQILSICQGHAIGELLIRSAYYVNQNLPTIHAANMIIAILVIHRYAVSKISESSILLTAYP